MRDQSVAESLEQIIFAGVALTTLAITSANSGFELTFQQWRVLVILGEADGPMRISEVVRRVGVTLPAGSRQLRRLERRGLVSVMPDERDRRAAVARLTQDGERAREAIVGYRYNRLTELAGPLEDDPRTRRELARAAAALGEVQP